MSHTARVLIVDDSATMRRLIRAGIENEPGIEVVAEAETAREARDMVKVHAPDVITLDIEMPGMDGLEFLSRLMRARPTPVIMVSSLTADGSDATIRALALGAVDCIEKPRFGSAQKTFAELAEKLIAAAQARVGRPREARSPEKPLSGDWRWNGKWILIGSSTGGVEALETILGGFPADCPPTMITQHMPEQFLESFARRLNTTIAPKVSIAADGVKPEQGNVYIAPGGESHLSFDPAGTCLRLVQGPKRSGHRPSVDVMMEGAIGFAPRVVAAILTGMGRDGAEGMLALRRAGATCIGQDQESSVVYGMPRVAMEIGAVELQAPLSELSGHLVALTETKKQKAVQ